MKKALSLLLCVFILLSASGVTAFGTTSNEGGMVLDFSLQGGEETYQVFYEGELLSGTISSPSVSATALMGGSPLNITSYLKNGGTFYSEVFTVELSTTQGTHSLTFSADFAGGTGVQADPYQVATLRHLNNVQKDKSGHYLQIENIDTGTDFLSIYRQGTQGTFKGTYIGKLGPNGERKEIGINITSAVRYSSVFGHITGATIKNIKVTGAITTNETTKDSTGYSDVGGISGASGGNNLIENCENTANIFGRSNTGGIIGATGANDRIINCINGGTVEGRANRLGGIVGFTTNKAVEITGCENSGKIQSYMAVTDTLATGTEATYNAVGGIVGYNLGKITNCVNEADAIIIGEQAIGGIAGITNLLDASITISNCVNKGTIQLNPLSGKEKAINLYAGGITGYQGSMEVVNCLNDSDAIIEKTGTIDLNKATAYLGGISGYLLSSTKTDRSVNKGKVVGENSTKAYIGGIIGLSYGTVSNSSNLSNQLSSRQIGGIVGRADGGTISYSFNIGNLENTAGFKGGIAGTSKATIESCFNLGEARALHSGGLVGSNAGTIKNSYTIVQGASANAITDVKGTEENVYYVLNTGASVADTSQGGTLKTFAQLVETQEDGTTLVLPGFTAANGWTIKKADESNQFLLPQLINNPYTQSFAMPELPVWDAVNFGGGYGTEASPYLIANEVHFYNINTKPDKVYKQTADSLSIDQPIRGIQNQDTGSYSGFSGQYDGNGKSISLAIDLPQEDYVGLFAKITGSAVVKNLTLLGTVVGKNYVGATVGISAGGSAISQVKNIINHATITAESRAGAIVGEVNTSNAVDVGASFTVIENCVNYGNISGKENIGGIVGVNNGKVSACANYGNVVGIETVGGIVGYCYNRVEKSFNVGNVESNGHAGGIAALTRSYTLSVISQCYNLGRILGAKAVGLAASSVHPETQSLGGVTIENSYNAGAVVRPDGTEPVYQINGDNRAHLTNIYYLTASEYDDGNDLTTALNTPDELQELVLTGFAVELTASYPYPRISDNLQTVAFDFELLSISSSVEGGTIMPSSSKYIKRGGSLPLSVSPDAGYMALVSLNGNEIGSRIIKNTVFEVGTIDAASNLVVSFSERPKADVGEISITIPLLGLSPVITEEEEVKNQNGFFTVSPLKTYGVFLGTLNDYFGWTLVEYGVVFNGVSYQAEIDPVNGKYAILFEGIAPGTHTAQAYAIYSDGEDEVQVLGVEGQLAIEKKEE